MTEIILSLLGGGALASLIGVGLQVWQKQKGTDIEWYDRAVAQVKMQDETIRQLQEQIDKLKAENSKLMVRNEELEQILDDMQQLVRKLETEKKELVQTLGHFEKKGVTENGRNF